VADLIGEVGGAPATAHAVKRRIEPRA